jgi:hypothetical protein
MELELYLVIGTLVDFNKNSEEVLDIFSEFCYFLLIETKGEILCWKFRSI